MGHHDKAALEANKLSKRLHRLTGQAIIDFNMIESGDRVMVCMSGGKDSYGLLDILLSLQSRAPITFELIAVNLDQGHPGFPKDTLPNYLRLRGVKFHIEAQDTYCETRDPRGQNHVLTVLTPAAGNHLPPGLGTRCHQDCLGAPPR